MPSLTTKEAAGRLGVSVRAVQALIKRGRLRAEQFGPVWAVDEQSVKDFTPQRAGRKRKSEGLG